MESLSPTRLLTACKKMDKNQLAVVRGIIENGISSDDTNSVDDNGRTALSIVAVMQNNILTLRSLLIIPGIDVNKADNEGNTPLHYAAESGQSNVIAMLLCRRFVPALNVDAKNIFGLTPLMKAAVQGRTDCCKRLIRANASVHETDTRRGFTAQKWARYCGRKFCADAIGELMKKTNAKPKSDGLGSKIRRYFPFNKTEQRRENDLPSVAFSSDVENDLPLQLSIVVEDEVMDSSTPNLSSDTEKNYDIDLSSVRFSSVLENDILDNSTPTIQIVPSTPTSEKLIF